MREISTVGVIGLGTMGAGIVEVFAKAGLTVIGVDGTPELAERGRGFLEASTGRAVKKGRLSEEDQAAVLGRVTWTDQLSDLKDADLVIEAVPERLEIKHDIFGKLDGIVREDAILASNTSSLSLTEIAAATQHPQRVIGMHFFNPAPVLALVEVITTLLTDDEVTESVRSLAEKLGKKPVVVGDRAGFVANALLITYLARAIRVYETGHVSREDLDNAGRVGIGLPMGPLTLSDLIGLDVVKEVCDVLYAATHEPSAAPPALLQQMVMAGRLGRKTGSGFYTYEKAGSGTVTDAPPAAEHAAVASKTVGVVGTGGLATELAAKLTESGAQVTAVDDPSADLSGLAGLPLVVLVGGPEADCEDCGGGNCMIAEGADPADATTCECCHGAAPAAWFGAVAETLDSRTVVVPTDEASTWALSGYLDPEVQVVPVRLHVPTRSGQLLEVARPLDTPDVAVRGVQATFDAAGFVTLVARDRAGLVVDALLYPHLNDAVRMLDSGYASAVDIDTAMTAGCGYPKGPFALIDAIGADEVAAGLAQMQDETGEPALTPAPLLVEHAAIDRPFLG
ncbi:3-hydroxybutyryl-CoA dehydrogenase [Luteipulveratus mongoliensis]|uniref:3-hydroxyacyl-CoA dehydrogenase n=1 Tax=Luteipulveratus mongoliensis TaxID=571913 RepID=A0A0K1JLA1_9MICO|nr:3-hydroxybutyryl-CoA dehydrogenase [Luteipulveratus mongoliensis]AKU17504.1 3-hydroxyacyl-CoA dehydrogenase [Luteipulveratus mongoliensis]